MIIRRLNILLLFTGFIFICSILSGTEEQAAWKGKIESIDGVKTIKNPDSPVFGYIELNLESDLILTYGKGEDDIFGGISAIYQDSKNNIYVLDADRYRIASFDPTGKYRFSFGNKGNGPGEFKRPIDFFIGEKDKIYVLDDRLIHIFDISGKFINQIKLNNTAFAFTVYENNHYVITFFGYSSNERKREAVVGYFNFNSILEKELGRFIDRDVVKRQLEGKKMSFNLAHYYSPELQFTRSANNLCVFGFPERYELFLSNEKGEIIMIIEKEEEESTISNEEKDMLYERYGVPVEKMWSKQIVKEAMQYPSHRPFFNMIRIDDQNRIYVRKIRSILERKKNPQYKPGFLFDVFDKDGYFIYQILIPFLPDLIRNGYLYSSSSTDDGTVELKRFKIINWPEMKTGLKQN